MKTAAVLLLGIIIGSSVVWFAVGNRDSQPVNDMTETVAAGAVKVRQEIGNAAENLSLTPEQIKAELERTGKVVRQTAQKVGDSVRDTASNAKVTAAVKARLALDPELSALSISVDTTQGLVTLSGIVSSHKDIARAMKLAMDTDGVREVASTLQVKGAQ